MENNNNELEAIEEQEIVSGDGNMEKNKDCIKIGGLSFELCVGQVYSFMVGRRTIIGLIEEINPRFFRVKVRTERGEVVIDLRKVSVVEEVK